MKRFCLLSIITLLLAVPFVVGTAVSEENDDREAVRQAVLDYVEGIYNVEPERIERSVSPELAKLGYWRLRDATDYREGRMSFDELVEVAKTWNANGRVDAKEAPKKIEIYDVMDQTATVKLSAQWGVDYMHLAKVDGTWMIMNVLWQSYPPK